MEVSHRHAPMCQRAIGIFGYHLAKRFLRRRVCKRMQKRHSPLKLLLHVGGARRLKAHDAELLRDGMLVLVCGRGRWRIGQYEAKEANGQCEGRSYRKISNCRDSYQFDDTPADKSRGPSKSSDTAGLATAHLPPLLRLGRLSDARGHSRARRSS